MTPPKQALAEAQARIDLGKVPSYQDLKLGIKFARAVLDRQDLSDQIKDLEEKKGRVTDYLFEEVAQSGVQKVGVDDYVVQIVDSERKTLSAEKLLEAGVSADVIARCMEVKHSTFLRVDDRRKASDRAKERSEGVESIRRGKKS
jgi:hypothetical protein